MPLAIGTWANFSLHPSPNLQYLTPYNVDGVSGEIIFSNNTWYFERGGDFVVTLNLSLSQADGPGWIYWQRMLNGDPKLHLMRYKAEPWVVQHGSQAFRAAPGDAWRLVYSAEALAMINGDPTASRITIHKV